MSYLEDRYLAMFVIDKIDDPVPPLSYPVTVVVPGELFGALRPGVPGEGLNPLNDTQAIGLGTCCIELLRSGALDQEPIFGHAVSGLGRTYRRKGSFRFSFRRMLQDRPHPRPRRLSLHR